MFFSAQVSLGLPEAPEADVCEVLSLRNLEASWADELAGNSMFLVHFRLCYGCRLSHGDPSHTSPEGMWPALYCGSSSRRQWVGGSGMEPLPSQSPECGVNSNPAWEAPQGA